MSLTDDRIQQMIADKKAAEKATARANAASAEAAKEKQEKLKQFNVKWTDDIVVIDAAVKSLMKSWCPSRLPSRSGPSGAIQALR